VVNFDAVTLSWTWIPTNDAGNPSMARKRGENQEMSTAAEPKTRPVRLDLAPDVHRLLRLLAANAETSMAGYARDAVEGHVREEAKRRNIKP
jgi:hypothetical protein